MTNKLITTVFSPGKGHAEVYKGRDLNYILFYDSSNQCVGMNEYDDKTLEQLESIAEDWSLGYMI